MAPLFTLSQASRASIAAAQLTKVKRNGAKPQF
jgi:hypothetical protein